MGHHPMAELECPHCHAILWNPKKYREHMEKKHPRSEEGLLRIEKEERELNHRP